MPEHTVIQAVYHNGELYGFIGNIAHVTEIGGKAVGGFAADAKEVYQEGLRLPPIKIIREGEPVEDIWKIILENHRTPRTSWGRFPRDARIPHRGRTTAPRTARPLRI